METVMPAKSMADSADRFCPASAAFLPLRRRTSWWYIASTLSRALPHPPLLPLPFSLPCPRSLPARAFILPSCFLALFVLSLRHKFALSVSALRVLPFSPPPLSLCCSRAIVSLLLQRVPSSSFVSRATVFGLSRSIYLSISLSPFVRSAPFALGSRKRMGLPSPSSGLAVYAFRENGLHRVRCHAGTRHGELRRATESGSL